MPGQLASLGYGAGPHEGVVSGVQYEGFGVNVLQVTAPLHGFKNADDYYHRSSSRRYLKDIHTRTLILHARDDPFMWPGTVPEGSELSGRTTLELTEKGGHVGFVGGRSPWHAHYWLDRRIIAFLKQIL